LTKSIEKGALPPVDGPHVWSGRPTKNTGPRNADRSADIVSIEQSGEARELFSPLFWPAFLTTLRFAASIHESRNLPLQLLQPLTRLLVVLLVEQAAQLLGGSEHVETRIEPLLKCREIDVDRLGLPRNLSRRLASYRLRIGSVMQLCHNFDELLFVEGP
jgi:hypothetical protein